jgi:hypothetical protein
MHEYDGVNLTIIYRGQLVITGMLSPLPFYLQCSQADLTCASRVSLVQVKRDHLLSC